MDFKGLSRCKQDRSGIAKKSLKVAVAADNYRTYILREQGTLLRMPAFYVEAKLV